ncbi:MAG: dihydrodipicolinate synthase family protein [Propionibacterium sp.]|nr:MAG: dihydrodipicolinate synthase family protein [Propionibacterium sp.]
MSKLGGIVPPLLTPMRPDGSPDLESLDQLVKHLLVAGVDGVFPLGSSGQVAYLTDAQRLAVVEQTVSAVAGQVPVLVGAPEMSANRVIDSAKRVIDLGADMVVVTAPVYAMNDNAEIERYYQMIANAISVPIFAYDVPVRTHTKLDLDMLVRLGNDGVIAGVKDSSGDDVNFRRLVAANRAAGSPLALFTGHEVMCDAMLLLGADGLVPGLGNVDPVGYVELWKAAQSADWVKARNIQDRLAGLFEIAFVAENRSGDAKGIGAFKVALQQLGVIANAAMPAPIAPLTETDNKKINNILHTAGLLS